MIAYRLKNRYLIDANWISAWQPGGFESVKAAELIIDIWFKNWSIADSIVEASSSIDVAMLRRKWPPISQLIGADCSFPFRCARLKYRLLTTVSPVGVESLVSDTRFIWTSFIHYLTSLSCQQTFIETKNQSMMNWKEMFPAASSLLGFGFLFFRVWNDHLLIASEIWAGTSGAAAVINRYIYIYIGGGVIDI